MPLIESLDQETPAGDLAIAEGQLGLAVAAPSAETDAQRGLAARELAQLMNGLPADQRYVILGVAGLLSQSGAPSSTQTLAHDLGMKKVAVDALLQHARATLRVRILDSAFIDIDALELAA